MKRPLPLIAALAAVCLGPLSSCRSTGSGPAAAAPAAAAAAGARPPAEESPVADSVVADAIRLLATQRNESLYYNQADFPANLRTLIATDGAATALIAALNRGDGDDLVRFNLVTALVNGRDVGKPGDARRRVVACLIRALGDSHPWVRTEAVWGLGSFGDERALPAIQPLLRDDDDDVRHEATQAIELITARSKDQSLS